MKTLSRRQMLQRTSAAAATPIVRAQAAESSAHATDAAKAAAPFVTEKVKERYVIVPRAARISRIVFVNGPVSADGGWFDTANEMPQIEVSRDPIKLLLGLKPDVPEARWGRVTSIDEYPTTGAFYASERLSGQRVEVQLAESIEIHAIRVGGSAGDSFATSLSARN